MQDQFELAPGVYGIAFAAGAVVLIGASQLNVVLLGRWTPLGICVTSLAASTVLGGVAIGLAATATGGFLGSHSRSWHCCVATGFVMPNAPALALSRHGEAAGTAAAMVGFAQFGAAAVIAPIVGLLGNTSLAIAVAMTGSAVLALLALGTVVSRPRDLVQRSTDALSRGLQRTRDPGEVHPGRAGGDTDGADDGRTSREDRDGRTGRPEADFLRLDHHRLAAGTFELTPQHRRRRHRAMRELREPAGDDLLEHRRRREGEHDLAGGGDLDRQPAGDAGRQLHRTVAGDLVDVQHVEAVTDRQVHGLAGDRVQFLQERQRGLAQDALRRNELSQFEQPQAQPVVGSDALEQSQFDHLGRESVHGRLRDATAPRQFGEGQRTRLGVEGLEK